MEERKKEESDDCYANRKNDAQLLLSLSQSNYWLTRVLLIRYVSFIYAVAFAIAYYQNTALIGQKGITPAVEYMQLIKRHFGKDNVKAWIEYAPSIFWFLDARADKMDYILEQTALVGLTISVIVCIKGGANMILMAILWILYHSIVSVGQVWYSFGWESQLLETGFLAIFLCPFLSVSPIPRHTPTSFTVILSYRWLIFRIMIGAGLIKIRGDECWRNLTCMNYHYETQPVPNPLSIYLHNLPHWWHQVEVLGNHFVELCAPVFLFFPFRRWRIAAGLVQILFQVVLISSGNLSFLNWLTIVPSLACLDDEFLSRFPFLTWPVKLSNIHIPKPSHALPLGRYIRRLVNLSLGALLLYLSIPVVTNLVSSTQVMNTNFDPFKIVNTYGAFGSVTKKRYEVIIQGTLNESLTPHTTWHEYGFKCKPGALDRRPCLISPYHYRLDWIAWFTAFSEQHRSQVLVPLSEKLLENSELIQDLLAYNPFNNTNPPKWIRYRLYEYKFTRPGTKAWHDGKWWTRKYSKEIIRPINLKSLQ